MADPRLPQDSPPSARTASPSPNGELTAEKRLELYKAELAEYNKWYKQWLVAQHLPPDGKLTAAERLELYKAELAAYNEWHKQWLVGQQATQVHLRKLVELRAQAQLDQDAAQKASEIAAAAAEKTAAEAADTAQLAFFRSTMVEYYKAYIEVAKGGLDRMTQRAQLVQAAAVAISALYTGLLAFVYTQADARLKASGGVSVFPVRGVIPTVFLGAAIAFAMAYLAFRGLPHRGDVIQGTPDYDSYLDLQRNAFVDWASYLPRWRIALIQLAIICLGLGVATLPLAFLEISDTRAIVGTSIATGVVAVAFAIIWKTKGADEAAHPKTRKITLEKDHSSPLLVTIPANKNVSVELHNQDLIPRYVLFRGIDGNSQRTDLQAGETKPVAIDAGPGDYPIYSNRSDDTTALVGVLHVK